MKKDISTTAVKYLNFAVNLTTLLITAYIAYTISNLPEGQHNAKPSERQRICRHDGIHGYRCHAIMPFPNE